MSSRPSLYEVMQDPLMAYFALGRKAEASRATRIKLHDPQRQIKAESKRFNVLDCGRRFGKTKFLCDLLVETAELGFPAGYFAPTYKHLMDGWRDLIQVTAPIQAKTPDQQEKRIQLTSGGVIECWSLDGEGAGGKKDYKAGRSRKYKRVVIDEAALVPALEGVYDYAISPTLIDLQGDAWFGSTPNGKGAFYRFWLKGQFGSSRYDPDWMSWQMPTSMNPYIPASEIEREKRTKPDHIFRQEYMAEFLEDSGQVFRNLTNCIRPSNQILREKLDPYHVYVIGWDLAKKEDFSVLTVIDCTNKSVVKIDRFNQVEYMLQVPRLVALTEAFQPVEDVVETNGNEALLEILHMTDYRKNGYPPPKINSKGDFTQDQIWQAEAVLRRYHDGLAQGAATHPVRLPISEFTTTGVTKEEAIQALVLAFEREEITIPDDPLLLGELEEFGMERLPSGKFRYSAPTGGHDDMVMSLAIGWYRARRYMSEENLPLRSRAIRALDPSLQPEVIINNPNPTAQVSQSYWVNTYEKGQRVQRGDHFMDKVRGFGK